MAAAEVRGRHFSTTEEATAARPPAFHAGRGCSMAGIIKKQRLKHLSGFTKNLSLDKINLSTLKGQGQLTHLELDEEVLQNVLELPTWLAITSVYCNRASIRIQRTKLKTHPTCLWVRLC
ncbi:bridge-like lipid transfer protein family member 3A [Arvicanthis niloticus]|uniref:bridge-like lipid transfer protein family member 3A n=1 Tax=Arvicanthis niloticus TaxID=61156 RepID=UPI00402B6B7D